MIDFIKMHSLGNDFIIIDSRNIQFILSQYQIKHISSRNFGIGCDQLIILKTSTKCDIKMLIYNADGSEAESCGNATRCVAKILFDELYKN